MFSLLFFFILLSQFVRPCWYLSPLLLRACHQNGNCIDTITERFYQSVLLECIFLYIFFSRLCPFFFIYVKMDRKKKSSTLLAPFLRAWKKCFFLFAPRPVLSFGVVDAIRSGGCREIDPLRAMNKSRGLAPCNCPALPYTRKASKKSAIDT